MHVTQTKPDSPCHCNLQTNPKQAETYTPLGIAAPEQQKRLNIATAWKLHKEMHIQWLERPWLRETQTHLVYTETICTGTDAKGWQLYTEQEHALTKAEIDRIVLQPLPTYRPIAGRQSPQQCPDEARPSAPLQPPPDNTK